MIAGILGVARLTMRAAVRSRLVLSLVILLVLVTLFLPGIIKGDGTLPGRVRVLLHYTLGFSAWILSLATLWASAGAVSQEIEEKTIQLLAAKPIRTYQVWLGKWLGILLMNAVLLCVAGTIVWFSIARYKSSFQGPPEEMQQVRNEILVSRASVQPRPLLVRAEVRRRLMALRERGEIPPQVPDKTLLSVIHKQVLAEKSVVAAGQARQWIFDVPKDLVAPGVRVPETTSPPITLRYRLLTSGRDRRAIPGTWRIGTENRPELVVFETEDAPFGVHQVPVASPALISAARRGIPIHATYTSRAAAGHSAAVFSREDGVVFLFRSGTFAGNFIRALVVVLFALSLLAALGLTAGSLFSFPVAAFVASSCIVILAMSHFLVFAAERESAGGSHAHGGETEGHSRVLAITEKALSGLHAVATPALRVTPLASLADGKRIANKDLGLAAFIMLLAYPACLWLAGGFLLARRELALPR